MKQTLNMRQQLSINLRYCYSSRRATQTMSATRNSPIIGYVPHRCQQSLSGCITCQDVCVQ